MCFPSNSSTSAFVTGHPRGFLGIFMWRTRPVPGVSVSGSWSPWAAPLESSERSLRASMRLRAGLHISALVVWKLWREWSPGFHDVIASNHTCSPKKGG